MNKKSFLIAGLLLCGTLSFAGGFRVALEGLGFNTDCTDIKVPEKVEIIGRKENRVIGGLTPLTYEWQRYEFSFVPTGKRLVLALSGTHRNEWVAFDDFKVTGGTLYNPSFEIVNADNEIDGWRYYAKECLQTGDDAFEGKNYLICARDGFYVRKDLMDMTPGQRVTISFVARKVKNLPVLSEQGWKSSGVRKVK